jgi:alkylhydroperoxidase family enzyme
MDAGSTEVKMAWIEMIDEDKLRALYDRLREPWGGVDNILKIHSLNPGSLAGHYDFYSVLMRGPSDLTRIQREMIAVVVSALNRCEY